MTDQRASDSLCQRQANFKLHQHSSSTNCNLSKFFKTSCFSHRFVFRESRSRLKGACEGRIAQEARLSAVAGLYERPAPARPPECARLPLSRTSSRGQARAQNRGQASQLICACPHSVHSLAHTSAVPVVLVMTCRHQSVKPNIYLSRGVGHQNRDNLCLMTSSGKYVQFDD